MIFSWLTLSQPSTHMPSPASPGLAFAGIASDFRLPPLVIPNGCVGLSHVELVFAVLKPLVKQWLPSSQTIKSMLVVKATTELFTGLGDFHRASIRRPNRGAIGTLGTCKEVMQTLDLATFLRHG